MLLVTLVRTADGTGTLFPTEETTNLKDKTLEESVAQDKHLPSDNIIPSDFPTGEISAGSSAHADSGSKKSQCSKCLRETHIIASFYIAVERFGTVSEQENRKKINSTNVIFM